MGDENSKARWQQILTEEKPFSEINKDAEKFHRFIDLINILKNQTLKKSEIFAKYYDKKKCKQIIMTEILKETIVPISKALIWI